MAHPQAGHLYERTRRGAQRIAGIQSGDAIGLDDLPVSASLEHLATHPLPMELAADNGDDAAVADGSDSEVQRVGELGPQIEQWNQLGRANAARCHSKTFRMSRLLTLQCRIGTAQPAGTAQPL